MGETTGIILAVDLGTHGARVLCIDQKGKIHSSGRGDYHRIILPGGIQEQELDDVWVGLKKAVSVARRGLSRSDYIAGISITHQRGSLVALDMNGEPMGNAICDSDTRSWAQAKNIEHIIGAEHLFHKTGCPPVAFNGLTKMLWFYQNHPEFTARIAKWASFQDWAVFRLSGELVSSSGSALRLGTVDIQDPTRYAEDVLDEIGIDTGKLIPLKSTGSIISYLQPMVAKELDLPSGIPIISSPGDQPSGLIGTGALGKNNAALNLGTSFLASIPIRDLQTILSGDVKANYTLEILADKSYALELGSGAGTNALDWIRTSLFNLESVEELNQLLDESENKEDSLIVVPTWWSALSHKKGQIAGIDASHSRADIVHATYRGLAFEALWALGVLMEATHSNISQIALFGGASRNEYFCQLLTDVIQIPTYRVKTSDASAFGAAICAAVALEWYRDMREAAKNMIEKTHTYTPGINYQYQFEKHLALREG